LVSAELAEALPPVLAIGWGKMLMTPESHGNFAVHRGYSRTEIQVGMSEIIRYDRVGANAVPSTMWGT
jgi:hypothetical protein